MRDFTICMLILSPLLYLILLHCIDCAIEAKDNKNKKDSK
jgi:hypothetical protein